ncbi:MAG: SH3 domain-containing protein, partial [Flavobacteriia bacterium]|nr:SH3 domain-containing protein [Flavobacteriia bacterium]
MEYAVCQLGVAAVRAESSDRSEMVTQILFGEKVKIIETKENWIRIKADYDGYEGWADKKQFLEL